MFGLSFYRKNNRYKDSVRVRNGIFEPLRFDNPFAIAVTFRDFGKMYSPQ